MSEEKELTDHIEITMGTPSKGTQITIKHYYDASEMAKEGELDKPADIKIKNALRTRQYLMDKGVIV